MIVAIHQPNYIPWLGYFYKMIKSDIFVLLDDVLHSKRSITNKNKIKTPNGVSTLSVPLSVKEVILNEVFVYNDGNWNRKHWRVIHDSYKKAPFFDMYKDCFHEIYSSEWEKLCDLNIRLIRTIKRNLGITTKLVIASDLKGDFGKGSDRNMNICTYLGGDTYLSGRGAMKYNDEIAFKKAAIKLIYSDFEHPIYPQLWGNFIPNLSIIDLLFNCGPESIRLLE